MRLQWIGFYLIMLNKLLKTYLNPLKLRFKASYLSCVCNNLQVIYFFKTFYCQEIFTANRINTC